MTDDRDQLSNSGGPARWFRAVCGADLPLAPKAVCFALATFASWRTGRAFPSVASVAKGSGVHPRTVRKVYRTLERLGVVRFERRSKGGRSERGRALVHDLVLDLGVLESLNPARGAGLNPERDDVEPGPTMPSARPVDADNPAPACSQPGPTARQSAKEPPKEQPTSTTNRVGGEGGGLIPRAAEAGEERNAKSNEARANDNRGVYDRLISLGVTAGKARTLAESVTLEEIEEATNGAATPGLIVHAIESGTARERLRVRREATRREVAWEAEGDERRGRLAALVKWALEGGRSNDVAAIDRAWASRIEAMDKARVVTLSELRAAAEAGDARQAHVLVDRLARAAADVLAARASKRRG